MTINAIFEERKRRFRLLLTLYKNQDIAASDLGFGSAAAVSNYKIRKNMGEDVARRIELKAKLRPGTMLDPLNTPWDARPPEELAEQDVTLEANNLMKPEPPTPGTGDILHDHQHFHGRLGGLTHVRCYELDKKELSTEVHGMTVLTRWLEEEGISAEDLVSIVLPDDSQGPRRMKGDVVAINTNYGQLLKNDKLYAIKLGEKHTLRRIAYLGSGDVMLSCSNPDYKHAEERIHKSQIDNLEILGEYFSAAIR